MIISMTMSLIYFSNSVINQAHFIYKHNLWTNSIYWFPLFAPSFTQHLFIFFADVLFFWISIFIMAKTGKKKKRKTYFLSSCTQQPSQDVLFIFLIQINKYVMNSRSKHNQICMWCLKPWKIKGTQM